MEWVKIVEAIALMIGLCGLFCMGRYLSDTFFLPREIVTSATVFDDEARENADILIHILKKGMWRIADRRICVLVSERYAGDTELLTNAVAEIGAVCTSARCADITGGNNFVILYDNSAVVTSKACAALGNGFCKIKIVVCFISSVDISPHTKTPHFFT